MSFLNALSHLHNREPESVFLLSPNNNPHDDDQSINREIECSIDEHHEESKLNTTNLPMTIKGVQHENVYHTPKMNNAVRHFSFKKQGVN